MCMNNISNDDPLNDEEKNYWFHVALEWEFESKRQTRRIRVIKLHDMFYVDSESRILIE